MERKYEISFEDNKRAPEYLKGTAKLIDSAIAFTERVLGDPEIDPVIAMLHINLLALYMFRLGASRAPKKSILYAGFLNIPYYLLLIAGTFLIKDQLMIFTEDTYFLFVYTPKLYFQMM